MPVYWERDCMDDSHRSTLAKPNDPLHKDLTFSGCAETTLGVELELLILDPQTGELVPGALPILHACNQEGIDGVSGEFLLSMLEIKTGICRNVSEVKETLSSSLRRGNRIARSLGYHLAIGGTHPFNQGSLDHIFPHARYRRILSQQGWMATHEAIFGLHVHVGVPDADSAIGVMNLLVGYLPHLLALSANSPFWQGMDTGWASTRMRIFRPSPHAGIPQHCACWDDFCRYCAVLHEGGVLEATKDLYWDIRPRPQLGTLEFRIFDAPPTVSCLLGLTALTRCLVLHSLQLLKESPHLAKGDPRSGWLALENKWLASRYGLEAGCVREPGASPCSLAEDTASLLERLRPIARTVGEDGFLDVFRPVERFESGAARLRRLYRQTGSWQPVLEAMKNRWLHELTDDEPPKAAPLSPYIVAPIRNTGRMLPVLR